MAATLVIAIACGAPDVAHAALGSAPFRVALMAAPEAGGNSLIIRIEPRPGRPTADRQLFDLYVIHIQGFQRAAFLTDSGSWSFAPVSVRRGLSMDTFPAGTAGWTARRLGKFPLVLISPRPSSEPFV